MMFYILSLSVSSLSPSWISLVYIPSTNLFIHPVYEYTPSAFAQEVPSAVQGISNKPDYTSCPCELRIPTSPSLSPFTCKTDISFQT